ncbi:MAG: arylformamidase [Pacificimonas sp.]|jgi:arylformamidase|nr:arylformamidase [Pacificimonas sp.]
MSRIIDISQTMRPEMPVWPGEPPVVLERLAEIGPECPVNVGKVSLPLHAGTHADAPLHYVADGEDAAESDLSAYMGSCTLVDASHVSETVEIEDLDWKELSSAKRVLIRTYDEFPHDRWDAGFKAVSPSVVAKLGRMGVVLIGTDAPSLDPQDSKTMDAHQEVAKADLRILEGLVLEGVPAGTYDLVALPLKLEGADATPVRAVLREVAR